MGWFSDLRTTALLKRIAKASERQASALETLCSLDQARFERETAALTRPPRQKAMITSFNLEEAEKDYAARLERSSG